MEDKPRVRFCWYCGKKLWANRHVERSVPKWSGDDLTRILHKHCSDIYDAGIDMEASVKIKAASEFIDELREKLKPE